ncbi:MAG: large-conductance mechanosensitive channel protein MscL [Sporocytophaga sp.]|uniref:large-conductance mechanosensitive channel protein MscL n=1 Tax=Sporocytophaga sp. TaxID=2231183 RepID=UPI001AFED2CB|nr:large-conductance mechanosensitive channel protein MscL [Sporocytophaga sp.]MBO9702408.1 large-conductance mechanosensitive channel protein MscL [Sporocytophaga sp.]
MLKEFKEFILRGNVIDLAVGVIIGAAFGDVVKSLVDDIIMPPIGLLVKGVNFKDLKLIIGGETSNPVTFNYGNFLQNALTFLITAAAVFLMVKFVNMLYKKKEEKALAEPSNEEILLTQIRDLLKERK